MWCSFLHIVLCLLSFNHKIITQEVPESNKTIKFDLELSPAKCTTLDADKVTIKEGSSVSVVITGKYDRLDFLWCNISGVKMPSYILREKDFTLNSQSNVSNQSTAVLNATPTLQGHWDCKILSHRNATINNTRTVKYINATYVRFDCDVEVIITSNDEGNEDQIFIYVGIGVGALVLLIIIAQTLVIIHFKKKARKAKMLERLEGRRKETEQNDGTRYSIMPGEKRNSTKRKKKAESGIYESLEKLNTIGMPPKISDMSPASTVERKKYVDIRERPPWPLPTESDAEHVYEEEWSSSSTPVPPSIDTLPKNRAKKNKKPKPKKPPTPPEAPKKKTGHRLKDPETESEEYDYPDSHELKLPRNIDNLDSLPRPPKRPAVKPARSVPTEGPSPVLCATTGHAAQPIVSELNSVFKRRNNLAAATNDATNHFKPKHFKLKPMQNTSPEQIPMKPIPKPSWKTQVKSPEVKKKPVPPPPTEIVKPVPKPVPQYPPVKKPPIPTPAEETYESVNSSDESGEEWTYEPLASYNIYNI